jgi:hypothetical protein
MKLLRRRSETPEVHDEPSDAPPRLPGELPGVAVLTMARDEGDMIRRWVDHHAAEVGAEHVIVIDDNSSDGSTDDLPCPVIRIPYLRKRAFEPSRMGILSGISAGLLEAYDAVAFCDADEFLVADPKVHPTLRHFVASRPNLAAVGVVNLNVVHDTRREEALRAGEPILGQRTLAKFLPLMCKPSLKWDPAPWVLASHGIKCAFEVDPELFMFHMKYADRDRLAESAAHRYHLNTTEGRAARTSWANSGDEMVALLDEITADIDLGAVKPLRLGPKRLEGIVRYEEPSVWRATGSGQVIAMRKRPFVRIPERFLGRL